MKKLVLIIVSVLSVNTINSQSNDIASIDANNMVVFSKITKKHNTIPKKDLTYIESIKGNDESISIKNLENKISKYVLNEDAIFDNSEKANYRVTFNQNNANAIVIYNNNNGKIVKSTEKYKNVKLPYYLAASISKNHPNFYIKETTILKKYKENLGTTTTYKVLIINGKKSKNLTLKF